jgi:hypothetical protein
MKKKETVRLFNFSDAVLVTKTKEKIAFVRRDAAEFVTFGIKASEVNQLETDINLFANAITDIEAVGDQTAVTALKDAKAEDLRVAIRGVMSRVELKFKPNTSKYRKFGTDALAQQTDADLLLVGKRVVRVANVFLAELTEKGITTAMLANITTLCNDFENLIIDMKIKIGERDVLQEERVEMANAIYATLVSYTNTGQSIWTTSNVAKYNDYVLYNTPTGDAPLAAVVL